jgi:hypothetical protein
VLRDEQNEVLDRLRTARGRPKPLLVLPDATPQLLRYRDAAGTIVADAVDAGARFLSGDDSSQTPDRTIAVAEAESLADELVTRLRERLARALADATGPDGGDDDADEQANVVDDDSSLADRLGAAYRDWKSERLAELSRHHLVAALNRGAYAAAGEGAVMRWVVDDDGNPCPDCDDNVLAGPTPKGEAYPTGQLHPPAHAGCRCILVPA